MPYTADISRNSPGCFLFLIDQSASMRAALGGKPDQRKMDGAADAAAPGRPSRLFWQAVAVGGQLPLCGP